MIYLDNAATTKMFEECIDEYKQYACDCYFNPSALYAQSIAPTNAMKIAKTNIAKHLGCDYSEIFFTASGSEGDNLGLLSTIKAKKGTVLISAVEHAAVANTAIHLKELGFDIGYIPVDRFGRVLIDEFKKMVEQPGVVLVSVMQVCNETGALNPIKELVDITKKVNSRIVFHCDGVQGFGKIPTNVKHIGVDVYSISSHKVHGPKGVGAVYIKSGLNPRTFIYGGGQESNIRSATENVPGIMAFSYAITKTFAEQSFVNAKVKELQQYVIDYICSNFEDCIVNTDTNNSSPYIVSFAFKKVRGEGVVHYLESRDIVIGTGSACSAKKGLKRIPLALNLPVDYYEGMLRISFDYQTTKEDIDTALSELKEAIKIEREIHK